MDILNENEYEPHSSHYPSDSERFQRDCEWFYLVFWIFILENAVILAILLVCCFVPIVRSLRVGWTADRNSENELENSTDNDMEKSYFSPGYHI